MFRTVVKLHLEYLYLVLHFDRFGACISQLDKLMTNVNDVSFYFHSVKFPVISIGVLQLFNQTWQIQRKKAFCVSVYVHSLITQFSPCTINKDRFVSDKIYLLPYFLPLCFLSNSNTRYWHTHTPGEILVFRK